MMAACQSNCSTEAWWRRLPPPPSNSLRRHGHSPRRRGGSGWLPPPSARRRGSSVSIARCDVTLRVASSPCAFVGGPWVAVLADMIDGVVAVNRLDARRANRARADLWDAVAAHTGVDPSGPPVSLPGSTARPPTRRVA